MLRLKRYENMICHSHFTCFLLGQLGKCSLSIAVGYPQALFWRGLQFHHFLPERLQNCCLWACGHLGQSLKPLQACKFESQVKEKRKEKQSNARGKPAHASGTCWMHISKGLKYIKIIRMFRIVSYCFVLFRRFSLCFSEQNMNGTPSRRHRILLAVVFHLKCTRKHPRSTFQESQPRN